MILHDRAVEALRRKFAAISLGATLVGALLGRKAINAGAIGRATTVARSVEFESQIRIEECDRLS